MNKGLEKWSDALKSAFPSAFNPYWRAMPFSRMTKLLIAYLFVAAAMGFVADLLQIKAPPLGHGLFWPVWFGVVGLAIFVTRIKRTQLVLPFLLFLALGAFLAYLKLRTSARTPIADGVFQRIIVDALATWVGVGAGYRLLLSFITSEGLAHVRMQTELSLAHRIQETLVPTVIDS
jgi:hypothetical protein